ncbi:antitoxin Xre/MbcA/ParS toxin-binding domain-containing protein [Sandarakinorhabdus sp.]|uniref:antitoxin Xre/MbcA/ParS toxin-binding domain-containing protein n=1 Tax=Sandarakinorhabdus sp. TaxID=1916663 RepID=UPI003F7001CA
MATLAHPDAHAQRLLSGFVASLQEPHTPHISPRRVADVLGVQFSRLADIIGVHRNTMRNPASERLQDRLRDMVRVITAAAELTGDTDRAVYWFMNEPIATLRRRTAAELVADGHTDAVLVHLEELSNGATG